MSKSMQAIMITKSIAYNEIVYHTVYNSESYSSRFQKAETSGTKIMQFS